MRLLSTRRPLTFGKPASFALLALSLAAASACNLQFSTGVEAKDTWTRQYKVNPGATLELRETNGRIRVETGEGDQIDVAATRIVKGSTEEAAKAALNEFAIHETATADRVEIDSTTQGLQLRLGRQQRVDYDVKLPRGANLTVKTTNGDVTIQAVSGFVKVEAVNGRIVGSSLQQGADVTAINGSVQLGFEKIGEGGVRVKTTNGQIIVSLPADAKATIAARVTNGIVRTENLQIQATEESRRRLDGTIGGGGPEIRLDTTNGEIKIVGK